MTFSVYNFIIFMFIELYVSPWCQDALLPSTCMYKRYFIPVGNIYVEI